MMVFMSFLAATAIVIAIALGYYYICNQKQNDVRINKQQEEIKKLQDKNSELSATVNRLSERNNELLDINYSLKENQMNDENEVSRIDLLINEKTIQLDTMQETLNANIESLNKDIESMCRRKEELEKEYQTRQNVLVGELQSINDSRATLLEELSRLQESILAASSQVNALHEQKSVIEQELESINQVLVQSRERQRLTLLENWKDVGELGIRFVANEKETQLVAAIAALRAAAKEVCSQCGADLSSVLTAINKLEWEKVWRPKLQVYRSELAGKQGIYKLTLVDDVEVCYIGQAKNIYERWFEHAKKMVGVDSKGNEKLYEYGISDFYWKVWEEVEDPNKLNEAEKYWIDYWCCLEKGLNKKR